MDFLQKPHPRSLPLPPHQRPRNRDATIRAVLESAQRLFNSKGFDNTSLVDIAGETGLSPRGVILHFSSKADIAAELLFRDLRARAKSYTSDGAAVDAPQAVMSFFRWLAESDGRMFINFAALWGFSARWSRKCEDTADEITAELLAPLRRAIERGIGDGVFRRVDPVLASQVLWITYLAGLRRAAVRGGAPHDALGEIEHAVTLLNA